ncbi:PadR family transcriptional regulator [Microbacterium dextranolyticum]|uniref:Transcriptional regulator n=1 Tax=Microbacterium dextranolyticum TaxID=36806 RepID=A0A9W6HQ20_9MICO|nr:PadR family transcriptional regulator [Microbacterium dextranolyticum]MBM7464061.1 DNA-binding PadR family transcriptional regulator [Microbacterium dextranolyticum]GLJ96610.1 transcriptional regulator [Microbacterium dextranolyticum]
MSVRQSLLAILDQGPCYGYQLRAEFDRRTGSAWPLNVGQIYNTLDRLERDGLVEKGETDAEGHVYWKITADGAAEARGWLQRPVARADAARDELVLKITVAATLPGIDVAEIVREQRAVSQARVDELAACNAGDANAPDGALGWLPRSSAIFAAENEVRWLDHVAARLREMPPGVGVQALSAHKPARGRPRLSEKAART